MKLLLPLLLLTSCTTTQVQPDPCDTKEFHDVLEFNWHIVEPYLTDFTEELKDQQKNEMRKELCDTEKRKL